MNQESSKARLVVVDDQNISRGFFEMYVRAAAKYELIAGLRTARESVEYVDSHDVDLLIMDVKMQDGIDGLTAAEKIKKNHPEIKIILILIDLPNTLAKTKNVRIRLCAVGPPRIRKTDLNKKIAPIVEADRLELSQVISEVSVDIVKEIK